MNRFSLFGLLFVLLFAASCRKSDPIVYSQRTIIVYMSADNDLYGNAIQDINEMERGWNPAFGRLVVYIDPKNAPPYIMQIRHDATADIVSSVVKNYDEQNSASATVMKEVIEDCMSLYPAQSYGLVLWSHGTGWLPQGAIPSQTKSLAPQATGRLMVKTFGSDNGNEMELKALANALPAVKFDFILFDACFMGSIEVAYELRNKANYLIASAAEVLASGFPYDQALRALYEENTDFSGAAQIYFNHYNSLPGDYRSATIAVTKMDELEKLAQITKGLVQSNYTNMVDVDKKSIQKYDSYNRTLFFDFQNFMESLSKNQGMDQFYGQLQKAVVFKANTPDFMGEYSINTHCGYSSYFPYNSSLNIAYKGLAWYNAAGLSLIVN